MGCWFTGTVNIPSDDIIDLIKHHCKSLNGPGEWVIDSMAFNSEGDIEVNVRYNDYCHPDDTTMKLVDRSSD